MGVHLLVQFYPRFKFILLCFLVMYYLTSPLASLLREADAFLATWSERVVFSQPFVSDTSPKCIDRESLGRGRTRTRNMKYDEFETMGNNI